MNRTRMWARSAAAAAMVALVAGCAQRGSTPANGAAKGQTGAPSANSGSTARQAADPVAAAVARTPAEEQIVVSLPDGRNVTVLVGSAYVAATGEHCRRIILQQDSQNRDVSAVCFHDNVWQTVILPN